MSFDEIKELFESGLVPQKTTRELLLKETVNDSIGVKELLAVLFFDTDFNRLYEKHKLRVMETGVHWNKHTLILGNKSVSKTEETKDWREWEFCFEGIVLFYMFRTKNIRLIEPHFNQNLFDMIGKSDETKANIVMRNYLLVLTFLVEKHYKVELAQEFCVLR